MKRYHAIVMFSMLVLLIAAQAVVAADFVWMDDFNVKAEADVADFRARIAARFKIGNAEIDVVFGNVDKPADVYTVFRLSEISERPIEFVLEQYKMQKGNGWGALAKSLGVKPGSREFHALKRGNDFYGDHIQRNGKEGKKHKERTLRNDKVNANGTK